MTDIDFVVGGHGNVDVDVHVNAVDADANVDVGCCSCYADLDVDVGIVVDDDTVVDVDVGGCSYSPFRRTMTPARSAKRLPVMNTGTLHSCPRGWRKTRPTSRACCR